MHEHEFDTDMRAEKIVKRIMKKGKIPGASIIVVRKGKEDIIKNFGYADLKKKIPVSHDTLFELASSSKGFTGLALLQLEKKKLINLKDPVSKYFPWFYVKYHEEEYDLTIKQLLYHTSGIPWTAVSVISPGNKNDSLEKTVRNLVGIECDFMPGKRMGYSTVNYDILGAILEKVTGKNFEDYMQAKVFKPLKLHSTSVGVEKNKPLTAAGYKAGLFFPGKYDPPVFRGNNPGAYIISNGQDIARWLKIQMGLVKTPLTALVKKTQEPAANPSYRGRERYLFAAGWIVQKEKGNEISLPGLNPTFSTYIGFKPDEKIGVAVLANCNSMYSQAIAEYVMNLFTGERRRNIFLLPFFPGKYSPLISLLLGSFLLVAVNYLILILAGIFQGVRRYAPLTEERALWLFLGTSFFIAVLFGLALYPTMVGKVNWRTLIVWSAKSFLTAVILFLISIGLGYALFFLAFFFPI
jgi:CubicO group peptidase (beta-lactamase class C family)